MNKILSYILSILLITSPLYALEDLDELETRTSRKSANTFYSGESAGGNYLWQPQTVIYQDDSTSHEVWLWTQTANIDTGGGETEYGWQPWSADGKRVAWSWNTTTTQWSQTSYQLMMVSRADQSYMRPAEESTWRGMGGNKQSYFNWSPVEVDTA